MRAVRRCSARASRSIGPRSTEDASPPSVSSLTRILLMIVLAGLFALLGVGARRGRISLPGPQIPESLISVALFVGSVASYAAALWFLIRVGRGSAQSAQDDIG